MAVALETDPERPRPAGTHVEHDIFIAYPSRQRPAATDLHDHLVRCGATVFLDHLSLRPGDAWASRLNAAVRGARVVAVLVSYDTERAFYQSEEIALAISLSRLNETRHRVVPIYLDENADPPYGLLSLQALRIDAGGMANIADALLPLVGLGCTPATRSGPLPGSKRPRPAPALRSPFRPGMPLYVTDRLPGTSRQALLATITDDLHQGNVNLVGERRLGRTTMLNHLYGILVADETKVVARVNLQDDVHSDDDFYGALLWAIGQCPVGAEAIGAARAVEAGRSSGASYQEVRQVLRSLRQDATVVVLLDEFERCFQPDGRFPMSGFFNNLRSLLGGDQQGPYARAVVATRQPLASYFTALQVTSTLPSYLPPRHLELLLDADVEDVLAQASPHRLGRVQRLHAARLAAGHPCRLQSAGEAWYRALKAGRDESWVEAEYARLSEQTCLGAAPPLEHLRR